MYFKQDFNSNNPGRFPSFKGTVSLILIKHFLIKYELDINVYSNCLVSFVDYLQK